MYHLTPCWFLPVPIGRHSVSGKRWPAVWLLYVFRLLSSVVYGTSPLADHCEFIVGAGHWYTDRAVPQFESR